MQEKGLNLQVHYVPVHLQPFYQTLGFKEGDFLQSPVEQTVYLLKGGKRLPVTYNWWMKNINDWSLVKIVPVSQYMDIPVGQTL